MMDNGFVIQNKHFDYLLNLNNEIIQVLPGEIAVPIKYMKSYDLEVGDRLILSDGSFLRNLQLRVLSVTHKWRLLWRPLQDFWSVTKIS